VERQDLVELDGCDELDGIELARPTGVATMMEDFRGAKLRIKAGVWVVSAKCATNFLFEGRILWLLVEHG